MAQVRRPPRLTIEEFRAFGRACRAMDAVAAMLHASGWSGKGVALVELGMAYEAIAAIYNRVEACVLPPVDAPPAKRHKGPVRYADVVARPSRSDSGAPEQEES